MEPTDVTFDFGWNELYMLAFVLVMIYGITGIKAILGGRIKPHMTRQEPREGARGEGDAGDEDEDEEDDEGDPETDDGEDEPSEEESTGDPEDLA